MNINDIDLSYSGLASLIDQDKPIGLEVLETITKSILEQQLMVEERKKQLQESERILSSLRNGLENCIKWTKTERPVNILVNSTVLAVNDKNEVATFKITNN